MKRPVRLASVLVVAALLFVGGCGSDNKDASSSTTTTKPASTLTGHLTVSAAASLTEAFGQIDKDFTAANPGVTVTPTFDSSGTLSQQILSGAPVDVFASADEANMTKLTDKGLAESPEVFAKNKLIIVTKPGNPKHVKSLSDLATVGVVSLCSLDAPCGRYADQILKQANVTIPADKVTRGQNVKATLTAVTQGDADAGIVYVTDAKAAGSQVDTVTIPDDQNAIASYPIAMLKASKSTDAAKAYVAYVTGDQGQATLQTFGFLPAN
jgi:molybdate transport system substrate-binding protein